jgi:G3E family GTPase
LGEIKNLATQQRFDYLLIESTGISEPLCVAETFTYADEYGNNLAKVAGLDTLVTIVDGANFLHYFQEAKDLCDTQESLGDDDERSIADWLIDQTIHPPSEQFIRSGRNLMGICAKNWFLLVKI